MKRLTMRSSTLIACVALYFTVVLNYPFYRTVLEAHPFTGASGDFFLFTVPLFIFFVLFAVFQIFAIPFLHKIIIPLMLVISAAISYNEIFLGVYFNTDMLENVLQTNAAEASKLIVLPYILWIIFLGVVPALLYMMVKVNYRKWYKEILARLFCILISFAVIGGIYKTFYQDYASFIRNNKQVTHLILPSNWIASSINEVKRVREANRPYKQIGLDAKQVKPEGQKRRLLVLVVGETTRAQNWGLDGYKRQTTPRLAARGADVLNFKDVSSCGTATAVSVPCMFSVMDRSNYNGSIAKKQDGLMDILQRANVNTLWLENDGGCKGACDRIPHKNVTAEQLPEFCTDGECLDNILLQNFDKEITADKSKDMVLVLHTMGSHGPTYYLRTTKEFRKFTPTCDTKEISKCTNQQLENSYDNSILYIDQFLDQIIAKLQAHPDIDSAMYYLSDHGESIGEDGIYLHGTPYAIAPSQQTHIPMVVWLSKGLIKSDKLNEKCLQNEAAHGDVSQDNVFHSVLGLMDVKTSVYNSKLDIFNTCKE